jgi:nucleoside-diphosphate-sugar epimerase
MKRVLVTGGGGFIGRGTLAPLAARGYVVERNTENLLAPDGAARAIAAARPTHLLHLAWNAKPGEFWSTPENLEWVEASLRLLRAFAAAGGERAVLAGTCAEYAWSDETHCVEASSALAPATLYGTAKDSLRSLGERFAAQAGFSFAWGRVFFVFGPHEHPARLAASVAAALVRGEPAETSHGVQVRDFLYSEDLADAFVALLDSGVDGAVNLASGDPRPIRALVEALADAAGRPDLLRLGARPGAAGEPAAITADVARLRDEVGWRPPRTLEQRAADTIAWWRTAARRSAAG